MRLPQNREETLNRQDTPAQESADGEAVVATGQNRAETFSQADLKKHWNLFAEKVREKGNMTAVMAMQKGYDYDPDSLRIQMNLSNAGEIEFMNDVRTDLMQYLRDALQNDRLSMEIAMKKEEIVQAKAYTPGEKFEEMVRKNDALGKLKDRLGLDPYF